MSSALTPLENGRIDSSSILHYIEALERKQDRYMEMIDKTYTGHITSIESKLDQLVDLTKTVAQLQVQQTSHSSDLSEVKVSFKELILSNKDTVDRVHGRLDILAEQITRTNTDLFKTGAVHEDHISSVKSDVNSWKNRFIGGVAVASILVGIIQWFTIDYLSTLKQDIIANKTECAAKLIDLDSRVPHSILPLK